MQQILGANFSRAQRLSIVCENTKEQVKLKGLYLLKQPVKKFLAGQKTLHEKAVLAVRTVDTPSDLSRTKCQSSVVSYGSQDPVFALTIRQLLT
jgi:hypothetical protein